MLSLSHLSLMLSRINLLGSQTSSKGVNINTHVPSKGEVVSLLDCDVNSFEVEKSEQCADLNDLITLNSSLQLSNPEDEIFNQGEESESASRIDAMIQSNIMGFTEMVNNSTSITRSSVQTCGLVKRR